MDNIFQGVTCQPPTAGAVLALLAAIALLFMSGFLSASEIAFFSLTPADRNTVEQSERGIHRRIQKLLTDTERLLATILIANNFVNITIIVLCNYFFAQTIDFGNALLLEFIVITVLLTFFLLLFGEIMPKVYAAQHALKFCAFAAPGILFCNALFRPLASLLLHSATLTSRLAAKGNRNLSVDELSAALELTDSRDISEEQQILEGIIRFGDETVKEVMTPRTDMADLDFSTPFDKVLEFIVQNGYSRIPVYQGSRDNIKGILYIKDLLPHITKGASFRWQSLVRPSYFVPETKMIDDLLRDFQNNKVHIAIVVDEFGGTSGMVTMEDIIEEIVGEINDEYDDEERSYVRQNENTYIFEAKTQLTDLCKILKVDNDHFDAVAGDADTLAGLLLEIKGEFPTLHERITYHRYQFEVLEMDARRIVKVKLVIKKPS